MSNDIDDIEDDSDDAMTASLRWKNMEWPIILMAIQRATRASITGKK